jgi:hypothetical protein
MDILAFRKLLTDKFRTHLKYADDWIENIDEVNEIPDSLLAAVITFLFTVLDPKILS